MKKDKVYTEEQILSQIKLYCAKAERTCLDVREKLRNYNLSENEINKIIKILTEQDYINEKRFAELYVISKVHQNKWGCIKISQMLRLKHIPVKYINDALKTINETEYLQVAKSLFEKKLKSLDVEDEYQKKYRLRYYLASHGFENNIIDSLFEEYNL